MPKLPIKPIIKLTKQQWKGLMERVLERPGAIEKTPFNQMTKTQQSLVFRREPPAEAMYGRLRDAESKRAAEEAVRVGAPTVKLRGKTLPLEEARAAYLAEPEKYIPMKAGPPAKRLKISGVEPGAPEEIYPGLGFETMKFGSVVAPPVEKAIKEEAGAALGPAAAQAKAAYEGDVIWKTVVRGPGPRSMASDVWKRLFEGSRYKRKYSNPREYFIAQYMRWKEAPNTFKKNYPRENNFINSFYPHIKDVIEKGITPGKAGVAPGARLTKQEVIDLLSPKGR